ncbi:MAG: type II secretion system protein [Planctomycetes bacterium]|nr:type II secretion system protein [Planctomycetota bacterium]
MRKKTNRRAAGLTLVELTATLAITGLIAAALLPVTANLSRAEALGRRSAEPGLQRAALRALIGLDLAHADAYRLAPGGVELRAHVALAPGSLAVQHFPATVAYAVRRVGGRNWLVRSQRSALGGDLDELVCPGVAALRFIPAGKATAPREGEWAPMPASLRVALAAEEQGAPPVEFEVTLP